MKAVKNPVIAAAFEYLKRQARISHPTGRFDNAGRWYPSEAEDQACCRVRSPSRAYPLSLNKHCRSAQHVANLYGVDLAVLKPAIKRVQSMAAI